MKKIILAALILSPVVMAIGSFTKKKIDRIEANTESQITMLDTVRFDSVTATTVPFIDSNKDLQSSAVTPNELGYLSGVTSSIQTQLDAKQGSFSLTSANCIVQGNATQDNVECTATNAVDLTSQVANVLPIANGGTGSSSQNFVDLTTNQTVAGEKTFTSSTDVQSRFSVTTTTNASQPAPVMTEAQRDLLLASEGDQVFNSDTNTINIYDGGAWQELTTTTSSDPENWQKNYVINGDFRIITGGSSFTNTATAAAYYTLDQWFGTQTGAGVTDEIIERFSRTPNATSSSDFGIKIRQFKASGFSGGHSRLAQIIENIPAARLRGKTATIGFVYNYQTNFTNACTINVHYDTDDSTLNSGAAVGTQLESLGTSALSQSIPFTASDTKVSHTFTLPLTARRLMVFFSCLSNAVNGAEIEITDVMLNEGSAGAPFKHAAGSAEGEYFLAMRYFECSFDRDTAPATAVSAGRLFNPATTAFGASYGQRIFFNVEKRIAAPTITLYNAFAATNTWRWYNSAGAAVDSAGAISTQGTKHFGIQLSGDATRTIVEGHWCADARL